MHFDRRARSRAIRTCQEHQGSSPPSEKALALTEEQAYEIVRGTQTAVLSTCDLEGNPYGVPITPVLIGKKLYFHTTGQPGGRRELNMRMNPKVSVCFVGKDRMAGRVYAIDFASAIITGTVHLVTDEKQRRAVMEAFLKRHAPENSKARNDFVLQHGLPYINVWYVEIEKITGKAKMAAKWKAGESLHNPVEVPPSALVKKAPD